MTLTIHECEDKSTNCFFLIHYVIEVAINKRMGRMRVTRDVFINLNETVKT